MFPGITLHYIVENGDDCRDYMIHGDTLTFDKEYGYILYNQARSHIISHEKVYKIYIGTREVSINGERNI